MKIKNVTTKNTVSFGSLKAGDVFRFRNDYFMKASIISQKNGCDAFSIVSGDWLQISEYAKIEPIDGEFVIKIPKEVKADPKQVWVVEIKDRNNRHFDFKYFEYEYLAQKFVDSLNSGPSGILKAMPPVKL